MRAMRQTDTQVRPWAASGGASRVQTHRGNRTAAEAFLPCGPLTMRPGTHLPRANSAPISATPGCHLASTRLPWFLLLGSCRWC
jgi:hypothetical protein